MNVTDFTNITTSTRKPCTINYVTAIKTAMYPPLGGGAALTNAVLILAILRKPSLRSKKEYRLTMALAFADFIEGFATMLGGAWRLPHIYSSTACNDYVSTLFCMLLPHTWLWRWSDTATAFMLVAVALDRHFAINHTIVYMVKGDLVARVMIAIVYVSSLGFFAWAWVKPLQLNAAGVRQARVCSTSGFIDNSVVQTTKYAGSIASALSVAISTYVAFRIRQFINRFENDTAFSKPRQKSKMRRELKFTVTTLIKGFTTLVLDSFPRSYGVYAMVTEQITGNNPESGGVGSFFFIATKINAMLNVFIYGLRQPEINAAVRDLFCCRSTSSSLEKTLAGSVSTI